jgi:hypothetical protein
MITTPGLVMLQIIGSKMILAVLSEGYKPEFWKGSVRGDGFTLRPTYQSFEKKNNQIFHII